MPSWDLILLTTNIQLMWKGNLGSTNTKSKVYGNKSSSFFLINESEGQLTCWIVSNKRKAWSSNMFHLFVIYFIFHSRLGWFMVAICWPFKLSVSHTCLWLLDINYQFLVRVYDCSLLIRSNKHFVHLNLTTKHDNHLQIYAAAFFAIPFFRWFLLRKTNVDIEKRNRARQQRAQALELPDPSLRRKVT